MKRNVGKIDRGFRVIIGLAIILFGLLNHSWFALIGLIPLFTATLAWCPLYSPFKISTCTKEECSVK